MAKKSIPFGYMLAANGLELIKNPEEQEILRLIQQLRSLGWTYGEILSRLKPPPASKTVAVCR